MKKLILLLLFVGFFSEAEDGRSVCRIFWTEEVEKEVIELIIGKCKKGDILSMESRGMVPESDAEMIRGKFLSKFCRFDREIIIRDELGFREIKRFDEVIRPEITFYTLRCVLNSNEPRPVREG